MLHFMCIFAIAGTVFLMLDLEKKKKKKKKNHPGFLGRTRTGTIV